MGSHLTARIPGCRALLWCLAAWFANTALAAGYSHPGGVAELTIPKQSAELPEVRYGLHEPVVLDAGDSWRILIGIELETLPGDYVVYVKPGGVDSTAYVREFSVEQKVYPVQNTPPDGGPVLKFSAYSVLDFANTGEPVLPLQFPVDFPDQWVDHFGHIIEAAGSGALNSRNYLSLTTTATAPVIAPQNGIVSNIELAETGLATVFLDHGRGLYSIIGGVADLSVEVGNGVVAGAVIGKIPTNNSNNQPQTITWQTRLNGVFVIPIILTLL